MSMSKDTDHQSLDFNVGRILQMFCLGDLTIDHAAADLLKFFEGRTSSDNHGNVSTHLTTLLQGVDGGTITAAEARKDIVRAAAAAEKKDADFVRFLHPAKV